MGRVPPLPRKVYTPGSGPQQVSSLPRKVYTPGSGPQQVSSPGRGRPKKPSTIKTTKKGKVYKPRKGIYRKNYTAENLEQAITAVKNKQMSLNDTSKLYQVQIIVKVFKKLLLGDNLASHISLEVINLCKEYDIEFVCLPPNSTDKMQPLDVGLFGPLKNTWRKQLKKYADLDPTAKLLQKTEFPRMLKELIEELKPKEHLPSAFEKCGLVPLNRQKVLERIPSILQTKEIAKNIDGVLLKKLQVRRFGEGKKKKPRGTKVPAGQSYTKDKEDGDEVEDEDEDQAEGEVDDVEEQNKGDEDENSCSEHDLLDTDLFDNIGERRIAGTYVVAVYEGEWFIAEVCKDQKQVKTGYTRLRYLVIKGVNCFSWGDKPDLHITLEEDIILSNVNPEPVTSRGYLGLKKKDHERVLSLMVLVYLSFHDFYIFDLRKCLIFSKFYDKKTYCGMLIQFLMVAKDNIR